MSARNPVETILQRIAEMTPAERAIAQYIASNQTTVIYLTARELAEHVGVSDATVVRFCQSLGYSGFKELKLQVALAAQASEPFAKSADSTVSVRSNIDATCDRAVAAIRNTQALLSLPTLTEVAACLQAARRVYLVGSGTSSVVARDAYIKLSRLGITALHDEQPHNTAAALALCGQNDAVLAFSHSGNTAEVISLLRIARSKGARIIAVTNNANSRIASVAHDLLLTGSDELPFHSFAMTSRMAQLTVVDSLVTVIIANQGETGKSVRAAIAASISEFVNDTSR